MHKLRETLYDSDVLRSPAMVMTALGVGVLFFLVRFVLETSRRERAWPQFPMVTVRGETPKRSFALHGRETVEKGLKECAGRPFQVMCGSGPVIMLPNTFANEIRNDTGLEFSRGIKQDFFPQYPGFDAFKEGLDPDSVSMEAIHTKLNPHLALVTRDLVEETTAALHDIYGESDQWQPISVRESTMDLVARTSSRVFLGETLSHDSRWLEIAKTYVIQAFTGAFELRLVPSLMRPLRYWFLPRMKVLRQTVRDARRLIDAELAKQAAVVDEALRLGEKPVKLANTLRWMYEISLKRSHQVDFTGAQLAFTVVATGAQSALHAQAIINVCERPGLLQQLRDEIIDVVGKHGWKNSALHKLELMDSYIKEIQRLHPANAASMNRYVVKDTPLSDGSVLPKGSRIQVYNDNMNAEIYKHPGSFVPDRYLKMRQQNPAEAAKWQLAAPHASNMGFGLGRNACPGRFFAVHHIKISLCHMLLKYDWRFVERGQPAQYDFEETVRRIRRDFMVEFRRRKEEVSLDSEIE